MLTIPSRRYVVLSGLARFTSIFLMLLSLVSCTITPPKEPDYLSADYQSRIKDIKRVALVADLTPPRFEGTDIGKTYAEASEAGTGLAGRFIGESLRCGAGIIVCLPVAIVLAPFALLGGAVVADGEGYPPDMIAEAEIKAERFLNSANIQMRVLEHIKNYGSDYTDLEYVRLKEHDIASLEPGPDYHRLAEQSIDAVIEFSLLEVDFKNSLRIKARSRLVSTKTNTVLNDRVYHYVGEYREFEDWVKDGFTNLSLTFQEGFGTIAEYIVDEDFLLFYPEYLEPEHPEKADDPVMLGGAKVYDFKKKFSGMSKGITYSFDHVPYYALNPIYPGVEACLFCIGAYPITTSPHKYEFIEIDTLAPEFRWQGFSEIYHSTPLQKQSGVARDVSYELRVFEAADAVSDRYVPGNQVYSIRNLVKPRHTVTNNLDACAKYFWTVRANFKLDGRPRVTEWSGIYPRVPIGGSSDFIMGIRPWYLRDGSRYDNSDRQKQHWYAASTPKAATPEWNYFPFKTPCEQN